MFVIKNDNGTLEEAEKSREGCHVFDHTGKTSIVPTILILQTCRVADHRYGSWYNKFCFRRERRTAKQNIRVETQEGELIASPAF